MIVVKLKGGLGNQFFQYAFARALSKESNSPVYLDSSDFLFLNHRIKRTLDLNKFNIDLKIISDLNVISRRYVTWKIKNRLKLYNESHINFSEDHLKNRGDFIFDGYWQSYKYSESIRLNLQEELGLKKKFSEDAIKIQEQIVKFNTVAVHFRRGDYVSDDKTNQVHGLCSMDYYSNAMAHFKLLYDNPIFIIFSDEIDFVKNELGKAEDIIYVDSLSSHLEEFEIMKSCNHFIIANSTFSWWAAWLSNHSEKKVVAPRRWFKDSLLESESNDLIPFDWLRM
jgi:hypothetical protein